MDQIGEIERLIAPVADTLGYELVRVQVNSGRHATLQIMAERRDRRPMVVDDCAALSRAISEVLDAADPIGGAYDLEVSSPGIDRPLMKPADYERFVGHEAKLEIDPPIDGRKRFQGEIAGISGDSVALKAADGPVTLPLASVRRAKLVLTDRLIANALHEQEAAARAASASMH